LFETKGERKRKKLKLNWCSGIVIVCTDFFVFVQALLVLYGAQYVYVSYNSFVGWCKT